MVERRIEFKITDLGKYHIMSRESLRIGYKHMQESSKRCSELKKQRKQNHLFHLQPGPRVKRKMSVNSRSHGLKGKTAKSIMVMRG